MAAQDNNLLTDDIIANEALRLLKNNLVMAKTVHRNYEREYGKVGDTIRIKLPFRVKSNSGRTLVKSPLVDKTIPLLVNNQEHVGLEYTVKDKTLDIKDFSKRYLSSGMSQIANVIDRSLLLTMKNAYHTSGTPGVRPSAFIDYANACAKQTLYAVPQDGMRRAILHPFTCAELSDDVSKLFQEKMVKGAYQKGYKGPVSEYSTYESQNIPTHTVGDHGGTPLTAEVPAAGDTEIDTDGWDISTTGLLLAGDVFTIAGVNGVNPQNYQSTGLLQEFVVQADVDSDGAGLATITFLPAMNDGTATLLNEEGQTVSLSAYQNIDALPADGAAIVVAGTANTEYEQNYLFHRDAIALAMIDLELPQTAVSKARAYDPDSGLSLTMTGAYDINEQTEIHRIDAVWASKLIYEDLALRLWGASQ